MPLKDKTVETMTTKCDVVYSHSQVPYPVPLDKCSLKKQSKILYFIDKNKANLFAC